jgi:hypothetical protein
VSALLLIDAAPDPVSLGIVAVVVLLVIGFVLLLATALVVFLWYRKRSMRHLEMGRPDYDSQFPRL